VEHDGPVLAHRVVSTPTDVDCMSVTEFHFSPRSSSHPLCCSTSIVCFRACCAVNAALWGYRVVAYLLSHCPPQSHTHQP